MAHPFYHSLQMAYPNAEIHFLSSESLESFDDKKFCSKKTIFSKSARRVGPVFFQLASQLKRESYDLAISLSASFSTSLLLFVARIPLRVGFAQSGSQLLWTDSVKWKGRQSGLHKSRIYLELLEYLTARSWSLDVPVITSESKPQKMLLIAPGASIPLRVWPHYKELICELSHQYPGYEIKVVGGKSESYWHLPLKELALGNVVDDIENSNLTQLVEWCRQSSLVVANDSGVGHLAGTLAQVPTIVVFGPGDPNYIKPLGPRVFCQTPEGVPCHPCEKPYCHAKWGYQACLKQISLQSVLSQVRALIPS